jgi:heat shock protein HslJ
MTLRRIPFLSLSSVLTLLLACGGDSTSGNPGGSGGGSLEGVTWVLDDASIEALVGDVPHDARVDLTFEEGRAAGSAACNTYSGGYAVDGDAVTFEDFAVTQMACEEALMTLETAYLTALGDSTTFALGEGSLTLTGGATDLTFAEEPEAEALPLVGTTWTLTTIALPDSDAVGSVIAGTEVTLVLAEDGTFTGNGGCNQLNGTYAVEGDTITLSSIASTKMTCGAAIDEQEQAYGASLEATSSFGIAGDQLALQDVDGADLLVFDGS